MPKAKPTLSKLEKKLDQLFSQYIRRIHADEGGTVKCVTCPRLLFWKEADCGHWIKRQHRSVRWDERNVAPQCTRCNHFQGGAQDEFGAYIIHAYGVETFEALMLKKHEVKKFTRTDLEDLIAEYKNKLAALDQGEKQSDRPSELQPA